MGRYTEMKDFFFGLCSWGLPLPGPDALRFAGRQGYDGVQILDLGGVKNHDPLMLPWVREAYAAAMEESGVRIQTLQLQSIVLEGWLKAPAGSASGDLAREALRKGLDTCRALHIPCLQVEDYAASTLTNEAERRNMADFLRFAAPRARDAGVELVYESFAPYDDTMALFEAAGGGFRFCFDTLNPLRYGFGDPLEELRCYDPALLAYVHVKDAPAGYQGSICLDEGEGRFQDCCALLKERGWHGWVVGENCFCQYPIGREDPAVTARRDLETLRRVFG